MTRRDAPADGPGGSWIRCATTGKRGYTSRRDARKARGGTPSEGSPLTIYRCESCARYHLGHMPRAVRRGEIEKNYGQ